MYRRLSKKCCTSTCPRDEHQCCDRSYLKTGWTEAGLGLVSLPSVGGFDPLIMLLDRLAGILLPKAGIWPGDSGRISSGCDPFMASRAVCVKLR